MFDLYSLQNQINNIRYTNTCIIYVGGDKTNYNVIQFVKNLNFLNTFLDINVVFDNIPTETKIPHRKLLNDIAIKEIKKKVI